MYEISSQIENINKKIECIKKEQVEILELISTITEMEILLEELSSKFEQTEKEPVNLEYESIEMI